MRPSGLFVVRHGITDWARERRFSGWRDIPLTEAGRHQCEAVAHSLEGIGSGRGLREPAGARAGSAEIIAKPHRLGVTESAAFREMGFGPWEGISREEAAAATRAAGGMADGARAVPGSWRRTAHQRGRARGRGAGDAPGRARRAERDSGHARHRQPTDRAGRAGAGPGRLWTVDAAPAGITEIEYAPDWATVHRMNTLAHLDGLEPVP